MNPVSLFTNGHITYNWKHMNSLTCNLLTVVCMKSLLNRMHVSKESSWTDSPIAYFVSVLAYRKKDSDLKGLMFNLLLSLYRSVIWK